MKNRLCIIFSLGLIFVLLSTSFVTSSETTEEIKETGFFDFLKAESKISFEYTESDFADPLMPAGGVYSVPIAVNYSIEGSLAELYANTLLKNKIAEIKLSAESSKEWCEVTLEKDTAEAEITIEGMSVDFDAIKISLDRDSPAYVDCEITLKAKVAEVKGPLGIATLVMASENFTTTITIKPQFVPLIEVKADSDYMIIPPLNITKLPINITNKGNGKTLVIISVQNATEHINISLPDDVIIESGNTQQIVVNIQPDTKFDLETLVFSFTPSYSEDPDNKNLTGDPVELNILLENDGSYKEDEDFKIDTNMLIILLAVIILLIVIVVLFLKKKKA